MQVNPLSGGCGTMTAMGRAIKTIPIQPAALQVGCGGCLHSSEQPVCREVLGEACVAPVLQGTPEGLRQVMAALSRTLGFDVGAADAGAGRVVSLTVQPGEVDLVLAGSPRCGGAALADATFQALRGLLPDTDIYVRNAG